MLETTQIKQRLPFIDLIRGITIIEMISYHFLWDLVYLYNADIPWYFLLCFVLNQRDRPFFPLYKKNRSLSMLSPLDKREKFA